MLNIIRADLYRIFKGKAVYITFGLFWLLAILQIVYSGTGSIGVVVSLESIPGLDALPNRVTGMQAPIMMMAYADDLIYFMLSIIYVISATDFSYGSVKNVLCSGISRTKFYLSKLLLGIIFCFVMYISGILLVTIVCTIINGFGGSITLAYLGIILKAFASQSLLLIAVVCIGMAIIFITKKGAALNSIYVGFFMGSAVILFIVSQLSSSFSSITKYDFSTNLKMLAIINQLEPVDIIRSLSIGVVCILVSTFLGIFVLRKSEIK